MNFISLCSGIEAASVALLPLGWKCVAVAEIEAFPCKLLKHYYPDVVNLGDVNLITQKQIEALGHVDCVIFGFPCQDLSVAGKRKGLKHADGTHTRSGLFYKCQQIADWSRSRWTLAENVPGIFSHALGATFAHVVGEMAGCPFRIPGDGWRNAGAALGPKGLVEWFVLDAQYAGLAQRRKRVFIVRDTGDWSSRPPLFLKPQSMSGNPPARRLPREGTTHSLAPCIGASGRGFERTGDTRGQDAVIPIQEIGKRQSGTPMNGVGHGQPGDPMYTLQANAQHGIASTLCAASSTKQGHNGRARPDENLIPEVLPPLDASYGRLQGTDHQAGNQGHPHLIPYGGNNTSGPIDTATAVNAHGGTGRLDFESETFLAFDTTQVTSPHNYSNPKPGGPSHPMAESAHPPAVAFEPRFFTRDNKTGGKPQDTAALKADASKAGDSSPHVATGYAVRRLTVKECARLQGFPDTYLELVYADAQEAHSAQVLHELWLQTRTPAVEKQEWRTGIAAALLTPEILLAGVHGGWLSWEMAGRCADASRQVEGQTGYTEGFLRLLREARQAGCPPQRRESFEQFARELGSPMSKLPLEEAQARKVLRDSKLWPKAQVQWPLRYASATKKTGRSSDSLNPDSSRYKALGNSFAVPCIRIIGQRIQQLHKMS